MARAPTGWSTSATRNTEADRLHARGCTALRRSSPEGGRDLVSVIAAEKLGKKRPNKLTTYILAAVAEQERDEKAAIAVAKAPGKRLGTPDPAGASSACGWPARRKRRSLRQTFKPQRHRRAAQRAEAPTAMLDK